MQKKIYKPTIIVIDNDRERCLRQEITLDRAIEGKGIYANVVSNFGGGYIARSGISVEKLPCIEIDGKFYFPPCPGKEITYDKMCRLLDILVISDVLKPEADAT